MWAGDPVDRASWPALILCFLLLTSTPTPWNPAPHPVHPGLHLGERSRAWKLSQPLASPARSPRSWPLSYAPWPHSQETFNQAAWAIRGALNQSHLCCCFREPRDQPRAGFRSQRCGQTPEGSLPGSLQPRTVPAHPPRSGSPSAVPQGPLIHWPRRLRTGPRLPLQEVPSLCQAMGGRVGGQEAWLPPCWFLDGPYVGSKK